MATITPAMVKELREKSGAGMLDCQKALKETDGNMEAAIDFLRKKGIAKAEKKSGRIAAEGVIVGAISDDLKTAAILEFNCETDFAAKNQEFLKLAQGLVDRVIKKGYNTVEELKKDEFSDGKSAEEVVKELIAKIGENMNIRRFHKISSDGFTAFYIHAVNGKIGVVLGLKGKPTEENKILAKDIAMHIAAASPKFLSSKDVTNDIIEKEKDIYREEMKNSGKPAAVIEKIVMGKISKYYEENCLLNQKFVKDPDKTIFDIIKGKIEIESFMKYQLGEGIEKEEVNFAEEVMKAAASVK